MGWCVCVRVPVFVHVCTSASVCASVCKLEINLGVTSQVMSTFPLETRSLMRSWASQIRPGWQGRSSSYNYKHIVPWHNFFYMDAGDQTQVLMLAPYFTDETIFQPQMFLFLKGCGIIFFEFNHMKNYCLIVKFWSETSIS